MKRGQRGSILILALWVFLFLTILAALSGLMARQEILLLEKVETRNKLYDVGYSGIMVTIDYLTSYKMEGSDQQGYTLNASAADDTSFFKGRRVGEGIFTISYDYVNNTTGLKETRYGVVDEDRKLNINYAPRDAIERLFVGAGKVRDDQPARLADAIIDWRDADDVLGNSGQALSERGDYLGAGYKYAPKNSNFKTPEELLLVKGMTPDIFLRIRDYVTVFGSGKVNINTAPAQVLRSLGMEAGLVNKIVFFRCGPDMTEGTKDDNIFLSPADIASDVLSYCDLTKEESDLLERLSSENMLGVNATSFLALCTSQLDNRNAHGRIICVFNKSGRIDYWGYN
jgi:hypothetical protein